MGHRGPVHVAVTEAPQVLLAHADATGHAPQVPRPPDVFPDRQPELVQPRFPHLRLEDPPHHPVNQGRPESHDSLIRLARVLVTEPLHREAEAGPVDPNQPRLVAGFKRGQASRFLVEHPMEPPTASRRDVEGIQRARRGDVGIPRGKAVPGAVDERLALAQGADQNHAEPRGEADELVAGAGLGIAGDSGVGGAEPWHLAAADHPFARPRAKRVGFTNVFWDAVHGRDQTIVISKGSMVNVWKKSMNCRARELLPAKQSRCP